MNRLNYRQHTSPPSLTRAWLLSFGLLGVALAEPASAATIESCELDCPLGTTCELAPGACPAIGCADPADCPPCDTQPTPYCAPAECESDSDCGGSMRCAEHTTLDCGSGAAEAIAPAAGAADEPRSDLPEAPACESSTIRQCTPRWQLPCTTDTDCGDGFRCEEAEACSVPAYDPSAGQPPPSSEPTCSPSGTFACVVVEIACNGDADCPEAFSCVDNPNGSCSSSSDGQTQCEPADPARLCAPDVVASPGASGDVATTTSGEAASADYSGDDVQASASQGGCSLNGSAPGSALALLSTLGLGAAFTLRRRRPTR